MLLLASSPLIIAEAHLAKTDSVLLAVLLGQWILWQIYKDRLNEDAHSPWLPFWACLSVFWLKANWSASSVDKLCCFMWS